MLRDVGLEAQRVDAERYLIALRFGMTLEEIDKLSAADYYGLLGFLDGLSKARGQEG